MGFEKIKVPMTGEKITMGPDGKLVVPDFPSLPFIEGDGIGPDITRAAMIAWNAAVEKAYRGERRISWMEIYAGEKSVSVYGEGVWLPDETIEAVREYLVAIKGPLTTPVGGGIRSLNVALRQLLDLFGQRNTENRQRILAKALINRSDSMTLDQLMEQEALLQAQCIQTEDHKNAVEAFFKKEKPVFKGR